MQSVFEASIALSVITKLALLNIVQWRTTAPFSNLVITILDKIFFVVWTTTHDNWTSNKSKKISCAEDIYNLDILNLETRPQVWPFFTHFTRTLNWSKSAMERNSSQGEDQLFSHGILPFSCTGTTHPPHIMTCLMWQVKRKRYVI